MPWNRLGTDSSVPVNAESRKPYRGVNVLQFDLRSAQGKLIASLMAALAEFERDLLRERVRSGIAAAQKRVVVFGRQPSQRVVKADHYASKVLKLVSEGLVSGSEPSARVK